MDTQNALIAFDALSQETRLRAFRLLVQAGPQGLAAGALSAALDTPHNTLSFHLSHMAHAGIVTVQRQGRSMIYRADFARMQALIRFLVEDCCSGPFASLHEDENTGSTVIELSNCCP